MPGGIVGRIEDHRTRFLAEGGPQFVRIKLPMWGVERHKHWYRLRHQDIGNIRVVKWFEHNDLVARIYQPQNSRKNTLCRSRGHYHATQRIDLDLVETRGMIGHRLA